MTQTADITQRVLDRCREMGFALAGVTDALPTQYERELREWLAAGKHGEMEYLARNIELRVDPQKIVPRAISVICVADRYAADAQIPPPFEGAGWGEGGARDEQYAPDHATSECISIYPHPNPPPARGRELTPCPPHGRVARYARGDDYHVVMRKRLAQLCKELKSEFPDETFRACVDTAPVLERELAQRAGLGAVGKNTLLIERGIGSYLLLGEIITTLPLAGAASRASEPDPCGTCTRCIDACPTDAITPWSVDATKCISYLTIEHRGLIDEKFHKAMGDWIFGCDVCQEVCPHNQHTSRSRQAAANAAYTARREGFDLLEVLNWDEEARRNAFIKSSMKRAKLDMMKRNALIAAGNAFRQRDLPALRRRIQEIAGNEMESAVVRTTAAAIIRSNAGADS